MVKSQYSSKVSPFQANTFAVFALTIAAAAWSWVEKILQDAHLTSAPSSCNVSIKTAVYIVMWRDPEIFAPWSTFLGPNSDLTPINPGISISAISNSLLPKSAYSGNLI